MIDNFQEAFQGQFGVTQISLTHRLFEDFPLVNVIKMLLIRQ